MGRAGRLQSRHQNNNKICRDGYTWIWCLTMSFSDTTHSKVPQDEPPSYNLIAPYAPPVTAPPSAPPISEIDIATVKGLPPGMEHLLQINQLTVREKFRVSQGLNSSYDVLNHLGQRLFQAEQSVVCCGPPYDVKFSDNSGNEVLQLLENCSCTCTRQIQVHCPLGCPVGFVKLHWNSMVTHLSVMNASQEVMLLIVGPSLQTSIFGNSTFEVKSRDEQHVVGMIRTESDQLLVSFPLDLEVLMKAALLGASLYLVSRGGAPCDVMSEGDVGCTP
ncbi:phospholipid scramblase 2-like isoform X2 [Engystomops pustulosus]|uniref:phospholipid scramblase 2-like isoform X2 n=1 Tax=Engystomops pustulosus TaxID=76066 RepID=UPI003AFAD37E